MRCVKHAATYGDPQRPIPAITAVGPIARAELRKMPLSAVREQV